MRDVTHLRGAGLGALLLVLSIGLVLALDHDMEARILSEASKQYGNEAAGRVKQWFRVMHSTAGMKEMEKLWLVNSFFNTLPNMDDMAHWGVPDYWATPLELVGTNGGDCEDFVIAKYFTLRELGVADERLRMTYVRAYLPASKEMQSHIVLTYHPTPDAEPLVLDNLTNVIKPASERKDLAPTYSFNGAQLWASKLRGSGRLSEPAPANLWSMLRARLSADEHASQTTGEK